MRHVPFQTFLEPCTQLLNFAVLFAITALSIVTKMLSPRPRIAKTMTEKSTLSSHPSRRKVPPNLLVPPTHIFTTADGRVHVQVLTLRTPDTTPHTAAILLPGNPGVIEFYRPTIRTLWNRLPLDVRLVCDLHALGLPGHDFRGLNGSRTFGISDHVALVREYISTLSCSRVIFLGHSYGSYLASQVDAHAPLAMLMPAVWQMGRCAGFATRALLRDPCRIVSWTATILGGMMPEGVRNMILNGQGCVQGVSTVVFKDGRGLFLNMGRLGREQMERIREVEGEGGKLLVWTHGDRWCPVEGRRKIQQRFSNIRVEVVDVSHAFVMSEADTIDIVRVVAPWLCDLVLKG